MDGFGGVPGAGVTSVELVIKLDACRWLELVLRAVDICDSMCSKIGAISLWIRSEGRACGIIVWLGRSEADVLHSRRSLTPPWICSKPAMESPWKFSQALKSKQQIRTTSVGSVFGRCVINVTALL